MSYLVTLFLSCFLVIESVHGAIGVPDEPKECGFFARMGENFKCSTKSLALVKDLLLVEGSNNDDQEQRMQEFQDSCKALQFCYDSLVCQRNDPDLVQKKNRVNEICSVLVYLKSTFRNCENKIVKRNPECKGGNTCSTIFGENNCAKELIIDNCGVEEWQRFKDNIIRFRRFSELDCNYEALSNF